MPQTINAKDTNHKPPFSATAETRWGLFRAIVRAVEDDEVRKAMTDFLCDAGSTDPYVRRDATRTLAATFVARLVRSK